MRETGRKAQPIATRISAHDVCPHTRARTPPSTCLGCTSANHQHRLYTKLLFSLGNGRSRSPFLPPQSVLHPMGVLASPQLPSHMCNNCASLCRKRARMLRSCTMSARHADIRRVACASSAKTGESHMPVYRRQYRCCCITHHVLLSVQHRRLVGRCKVAPRLGEVNAEPGADYAYGPDPQPHTASFRCGRTSARHHGHSWHHRPAPGLQPQSPRLPCSS